MEVLRDGSVTSPLGYLASGIVAGIKQSGKRDLAIIHSEFPAKFSCAFTENSFAAPPVRYCESLCQTSETIRSIVINSGNANACTGIQGSKDVQQMADHAAKCLNINAHDVLISSTGRIGVCLPMNQVVSGIEIGVSQDTPEATMDTQLDTLYAHPCRI